MIWYGNPSWRINSIVLTKSQILTKNRCLLIFLICIQISFKNYLQKSIVIIDIWDRISKHRAMLILYLQIWTVKPLIIITSSNHHFSHHQMCYWIIREHTNTQLNESIKITKICLMVLFVLKQFDCSLLTTEHIIFVLLWRGVELSKFNVLELAETSSWDHPLYFGGITFSAELRSPAWVMIALMGYPFKPLVNLKYSQEGNVRITTALSSPGSIACTHIDFILIPFAIPS